MKTRKSVVSLVLLTLLLVLGTTSFYTVMAAGTTYYVDAVSGSDSNTGTSEASAWQTLTKVNNTTFTAGDRILLKAGCVWTGNLSPKGSGVSGNPITIDMYGTGNKPIINGNGKAYTAHPPNNVDAAVYLCNQDYWTIRNLEVTNDATTVGERQGIHIDATSGSHTGITIEYCTVHNVASDGNFSEHARLAAINVWARGWNSAFSNVLIDNNEVYATGSTGIFINAERYAGTATGNKISNNYLHDIGGDGILMNGCNNGLVEYNLVAGSHVRSNLYCVAIWPFDCDNAVLQYNEAYNTVTTLDGQGIDSDYQCRNSLFQYNYIHDNEGGFFLICCEPTTWDGQPSWNDGTVIRYNIAQNNSNSQFALSSKITNTTIYNNTIYVGPSINASMVGTYSRDGVCWPSNTIFYNNIFYILSDNPIYNFGNSTGTVFDYNIFYGNHDPSEPYDPHKLTSDPLLVNPGSASVGRDSCYGYMLKEGSPAAGSGMLIANNGGQDFWGNPVSGSANPNRGAYNGGASYISPSPATPTASRTPTPTSTPPAAGVDDEFSSSTLGSQWSWVRENPSAWSLTARPGYMRLICTNTDINQTTNTGQNILLQAAPGGDWSIIARLEGKPTAAWQQGGVIVYQNDDNYFKFVRLYSQTGGNLFQLVKEVAATKTEGTVADTLSTAAYLKVEKSGTNYSAFYSADGLNYTQVWTTQTANLGSIKVGMVCFAGTGYNADFDYFHFGNAPPAATPTLTPTATPTTTVVPTGSPTVDPSTSPTIVPTNSPTATPTTTAGAQAPFGGVPWAVPGTIQAEDFDEGGEGIAYHDNDTGNTGGQYRTTGVDISVCTDTGGGYQVGYTTAGEWLEYTVNVPTAGVYTINIRLANTKSGATFHIEFNGVNKTGALTVPNTGNWSVFQTVTTTVSLSAGQQVMRYSMDTAARGGTCGNFNYITITQ